MCSQINPGSIDSNTLITMSYIIYFYMLFVLFYLCIESILEKTWKDRRKFSEN